MEIHVCPAHRSGKAANRRSTTRSKQLSHSPSGASPVLARAVIVAESYGSLALVSSQPRSRSGGLPPLSIGASATPPALRLQRRPGVSDEEAPRGPSKPRPSRREASGLMRSRSPLTEA
jgi:hypothetical protein